MRSRQWLGAATVAVLAIIAGCGGEDTTGGGGASTTSSTTTSSTTTSSTTTTDTTTTTTTGGGGTGGEGLTGGGGTGGATGGGGTGGATGGGGTGGATGGGGTGGATGGGGTGGATGGGGTGGATGGGGTGGGGGPPAPANDVCPGTPVSLAPGGFVTLPGSTVNANDDYPSFCADVDPADDAPDVVYEVTLSGGGNLTLLLDDHLPGKTPFDGAISMRKTGCDVRVALDECINFATQKEKYVADVKAGTFYVVIDGASKSAGDFVFTLKLDAPKCGDGIVNAQSAGEECDPQPQNDTCYPPGDPNQCKFKPPPVPDLEKCPGIDVALEANKPLTLGPNNTTNFKDDYKGTCPGLNAGGRDHVYHVLAKAKGKMTLKAGFDPQTNKPFCDACVGFDCPPECWTTALYVRSGACEGGQAKEIGCFFDPNFSLNGAAQLTVDVEANKDYWVFVDSNESGDFTAGPYFLQLSLVP